MLPPRITEYWSVRLWLAKRNPAVETTMPTARIILKYLAALAEPAAFPLPDFMA
jgi:hypothetical protein